MEKKSNPLKVKKDLGVLITRDLKPAQHVGAIVAKANKIISLIKRNFTYMDIDMCRTLYCSMVQPYLEYAVQSLSPYYKKDINELEKIKGELQSLYLNLENCPMRPFVKELA